MQGSGAAREAMAVIARLGLDATRAGIALCVYSAALLAASLLLVTSWAPSGVIVGAAVVGLAHASAGLALVRKSVGRRVLVATSGGLHVVLTIAWLVVLVNA